ncbi:hypothetical protein ETB97_006576 [Aspergillus alliaceus]|uniref:Uncharacterized protein n=1 Tax=Petromyces alliaceus TaxID=209559 RepID=A0A8H6AA39_PETAA|nr:hypothetical protein ETB97_006576 [Aspergillus burnettii]
MRCFYEFFTFIFINDRPVVVPRILEAIIKHLAYLRKPTETVFNHYDNMMFIHQRMWNIRDVCLIAPKEMDREKLGIPHNVPGYTYGVSSFLRTWGITAGGHAETDGPLDIQTENNLNLKALELNAKILA